MPNLLPKSDEIIAFITPVVSLAAGIAATWLLNTVHFLSIFHVGHDSVAKAIVELGTLGVTMVLTYLTGHHILKLRAQHRLVPPVVPSVPSSGLESGRSPKGSKIV